MELAVYVCGACMAFGTLGGAWSRARERWRVMTKVADAVELRLDTSDRIADKGCLLIFDHNVLRP